MPRLVMLLPIEATDVSLRSTAIEGLAELGVTNVALAQDDQIAAVILEGWAFEPDQHEAALAALGASPSEARALHTVVEMAVTTAATEGGPIR